MGIQTSETTKISSDANTSIDNQIEPKAGLESDNLESQTASNPELADTKDQELVNLRQQLKSTDARIAQQLGEILTLYRRIHIELDDAGRSQLIVDLFADSRIQVQLLGFELTDRDLSSSTVLNPEVGESAKTMLKSTSPVIRSKAARLITRLVPPDALIVLTESLHLETDPLAAEPMLMGIARWPSPEAVEPVLEWFLRDDTPFDAACNAAWSLEDAGYLDTVLHHPMLLDLLHSISPDMLRESGMKLIARIGDSSDLRMLMGLLLAENQDQQQWSANALLETPRAVELLVQAAEGNSQIFRAASDSLILHRSTPEGLRRLVSLPYPNEEVQLDAIVRMGAALESDRLAEGVRLAGLNPHQSVLLLKRLLNGNVELTPRVAKGIIRLAEIELDELRPNRALEAAIALDKASLDPTDKAKIDSYKSISIILLGKLDEAMVTTQDPEIWFASFLRTPDTELKKRIARVVLASFTDSLSQEQVNQLQLAAEITPQTGQDSRTEPVEQPATSDQDEAD